MFAQMYTLQTILFWFAVSFLPSECRDHLIPDVLYMCLRLLHSLIPPINGSKTHVIQKLANFIFLVRL